MENKSNVKGLTFAQTLYTLMKSIEEKFTFTKKERLSGTKRIDYLFKEGDSFISYPLRVLYLTHEQSANPTCSILISVPKKRVKKAVQRNQIKRLIRESYRLNKTLIGTAIDDKTLDIAFIYVKDTVSDFQMVEKAMKKALTQISNSITNITDR